MCEDAKFVPRFKGKMQLYLDGATIEEVMAKSKFEGHWATRRDKIMRKPRLYLVNLYLYDEHGKYELDRAQFVEYGTTDHVWRLIVKLAKETFAANPDTVFDRDKCKATIKA